MQVLSDFIVKHRGVFTVNAKDAIENVNQVEEVVYSSYDACTQPDPEDPDKRPFVAQVCPLDEPAASRVSNLTAKCFGHKRTWPIEDCVQPDPFTASGNVSCSSWMLSVVLTIESSSHEHVCIHRTVSAGHHCESAILWTHTRGRKDADPLSHSLHHALDSHAGEKLSRCHSLCVCILGTLPSISAFKNWGSLANFYCKQFGDPYEKEGSR